MIHEDGHRVLLTVISDIDTVGAERYIRRLNVSRTLSIRSPALTKTIRTLDCLWRASGNPLAKCQSIIVTKILFKVLSSNESKVTSIMCLVSRLVIRLDPPPGGSMADTNSWKIKRDYWLVRPTHHIMLIIVYTFNIIMEIH